MRLETVAVQDNQGKAEVEMLDLYVGLWVTLEELYISGILI